MKNCTYVFRTVLCICIAVAGMLPGYAQQIERGIRVSTGEYLGFLEYKPVDYASKTTTKYPLIIFLHGIGERGNGTTELQKVACCGIPRIIKRGHDMKFTWNGKTETFIVLSPQAPKTYGMWPNHFIQGLIDYAKNTLRVDPNRIFLTGLSMGGGGTFKFISTSPEQPKNLAAAATICAPCTFKEGKYPADAKLPFWGFHAADDAIAPASCTESAVRKINEQNPAVKPLKTIWPTGGHIVWDRVYTDTNYRYQGIVNIYEWFLAQNKSFAVNKLPVANAGNSITINASSGTATLNGSASTDADGRIVRYVWKKIEGPTAGVITTPFGTKSTTTVTGLTIPGTYKYELNVVDDRAAFTSDVVTVVVTTGVTIENKLPVAKAGTDIVITLPLNKTTLDGSASTDPDGTISTYAWTRVSGPAATIWAPSNATTSVSNLVEGTYVFKLKVTDNKGDTGEDQVSVIVKPAPVEPNKVPIARAGINFNITLPVNTATLDGSGSEDLDGTIKSYQWSKVSGTGGTIQSTSTAKTTVSNLSEGTYIFKLIVTDDDGATGEDQITLTVNPAPAPANRIPVADAGTDISITLPVNKTVLNGSSSTDTDGTLESFDWMKVSGPASFIIADVTVQSTNLSNLSEGVYLFRLQVTDNKGAKDADTVKVTVLAAPPPPNVAPHAQAGANKSITLPVDYSTLDGNGSSDEDGTIEFFNWSFVSGPESFVIAAPNSASTNVTGLIEGTYSFRLEVKDNDGAINADTIIITVTKEVPPPNILPVARAGEDITITLPADEVTLNGAASNDEDGTLTNYSWIKISGPDQLTIANPSYHVTQVKNLVEGTYSFRLQVKDNDGALGYDTIIVNVLHALNVTPVSKAGRDLEIRLPVSQVELTGTDSYDPDGSVQKYFWEFVSGPLAVTPDASNAVTTIVRGLAEGEYLFRLTVTDDKGVNASDVVKVTVLPEPPNSVPVALAGADAEVQLPDALIRLDGTSSYDTDGEIKTYSWVKVSGPGGATISNSTTAKPAITGVVAGEYTFRLTVIDDDGAAASDIVNVLVHPAPPVINQKPVAHAGEDQTISYPVSAITLDGKHSVDNDGTIAEFEWKLVSGPSNPTIISPSQATSEVNGLQAGEYIFELFVVDDKGDECRDTVSISVINTMRYEEQMTTYPNPAVSSLNVQLTSDTMGATKITIYNSSGTIVKSVSTQKTQPQLFENINVSNLQTGLYYVEVVIGNKLRKINKIIKRQ